MYAVLQTDSVVAELQTEHGDYPAMFRRLLSAAGLPAQQIAAIDMRNLPVADLPDPTDYAGYLITGSKHSVYDNLPWIAQTADFARAAMAAQRPVVGICFGHQLLAHFFGGKVGPADNGWAVGVHHNQVLTQQKWMQPASSSLAMLSSHQDQVLELPPQAQRFALTSHCPNAGFTLGRYGLAMQSHPEFSADYARRLMNRRIDSIGAEVVDAAIESMQCPLDNQVAARWIVNFLTQFAVQPAAVLEGAN